MEDNDSRKERFQGPQFEDPRENALYKRFLSMKQEREAASLRNAGRAVNLEDAVDIVGTCDMMCPEFESLQRYFADDLDPFERSPTGAYDRSRMVEIFKRAAAGTDLPPPEDIRPPPILRKTVDYLFDTVLVQHGIDETHNFIWNRTRAIRNDLTRQRDHSENAIYCLERIVRFHILAHHLVCRGFREKEAMEIEQLKKALQSLTEVYQDARPTYTSSDEPEFRCYYVLMHVRSRHVPFTLRTVPSWVYSSPILQWASKLRFTLGRNTEGGDEHGSDVTQMDYAGFFDLVAHPATSYLSACLLEATFDDIRRQTCLMLGLTLKGTARLIPFSEFQRLLRLDSDEDTRGWLTHLRWKLTLRGFVEVPQSRKADNLLPAIATADQYPRSRSMIVQAKRSTWHGDFPGSLDAVLINGDGRAVGTPQIDPPSLPRQRRPRINSTSFPQTGLNPSAAPFVPRGSALPFKITSTPSGPPAFTSPVKPTPQAPVKHVFNPFGPRPSSVATPAPPQAPTFAFKPTATTVASNPNPNPFLQSNSLGLQSNPSVAQPQSFPQVQPRLQSQVPPQTQPPRPPVQLQAQTPQPPVPQPQAQLPPPPQPVAFPVPNFSTFKPPSLPISNALSAQSSQPALSRPQVNNFSTAAISTSIPAQTFVPKSSVPVIARRRSTLPQEPSESFLTDTTPPARPFDRRAGLSDTDASATSSLRPASSRGDARELIQSNGIRNYGAESHASTDTEAVGATPEVPVQGTRLNTLKSFVQQWRDTSDNGKPNDSTEASIYREQRKAQAEQTALQIPLESRFTDPRKEFTNSTSKKRIMYEADATQTFMMAEKEAEDRKRVWTPKMFSRIASQIAKRKAAGKDLPAGWQIWVSFVPEGVGAEWLKIKFAGDTKAPDLANISVGPPANSETVAAPGVIILHVEPGAWDDNLRRAKEVFDLLPADSPYIPGLLLIMISDGIEMEFPATFVSKLDRLLRDVILDRRAVILTSLESAQVIDDEFSTQLSELNFDVEGQAPRLELKELVSEYMNWWMVEYQYAFGQVYQPEPELDYILLALSVLMSGLDEFLRQVLLQCRVTQSDIPFNNFQSKHSIESACMEILHYLNILGGSVAGLPSTPVAILQQPEVIFKTLLRIAEVLRRRVLEYSDLWQPRAGLRRPLLEKMGKEYNDKLEQDLKPIDRSKIIYSSSVPTPSLNQSALKRKRVSSITGGHAGGTLNLSHSVSSLRSSTGSTITPKRSRGTLEESNKSDPPLKLSFKVQMAKGRLDLQVLQAVDVEKYKSDEDIAAARADALSKIAEPLVQEVLRSELPSDKAVIECRAVLELIDGVQEAVMNELCKNAKIIRLIQKLGELNDLPGSLEFRQLVFAANRFADRMRLQ